MNNYGFQFKSPTSYGDWATYAGFDRTTGTTDFGGGIEPPRSPTIDESGKPIEPPKNLSEYFDRKVQPVKDAWNQISAAGSQFSQGNVMNAYNTMKKPASQFGMTPAQTNEAITFDHFWN